MRKKERPRGKQGETVREGLVDRWRESKRGRPRGIRERSRDGEDERETEWEEGESVSKGVVER